MEPYLRPVLKIQEAIFKYLLEIDFISTIGQNNIN